MASVNLYLKDKKAVNKTRVYVVLTARGGVKIQIPSNHSINPKHWSKKGGFVLSANPNSIEINNNLRTFKETVLNEYLKAEQKQIIVTAEYIREQLKPNKEVVTQSKVFWNVWSYYLESKKNNYKPRSFIKFKGIAKHIKNYEIYSKIPLELDTITSRTLNNIQDYFYNKANLNTQTTAKNLDLFKVFLSWALNEKYTANTAFKSFKSIKQPDALQVTLSKDDISKIEKASIDKDYLINVRELLILSTLTGLRHSDYSRISKEHIKPYESNDNRELKFILEIRMEKTDSYVKIPIIEKTKKILDKILSGEIHAISNQKMNLYIKELCEIAGINEPFEIHQYKGKISITKSIPKHELITTHTGRRTFATNLLLKGVDSAVVMKHTGHKDYKSFRKYVNIPEERELEMVAKALLG